MIIVALGSNMAGPWGGPAETIARALRELGKPPLRLVSCSRLLRTAPYGRENQAAFVNAVARIETHLPPQALLVRLQAIERAAGRRRTLRWGPRTLDLDLIDYNGMNLNLRGGARQSLRLPHPGLADRLFVLQPLVEIAPRWRHPETRLSARQLLRKLQGEGHGEEL